MKKRLTAAAAMVLAALALAAPSNAASEEWTLTPAGFAKGDIRYVRTVPFETGTAIGAVRHKNYLYVTTWRSFSIYDVSNALDPERLSTTPLPVQLINENPTTNGEILLLNDDMRRLMQVWDVRDKRTPVLLAQMPYPTRQHIWTCVLDCSYAYGAGGAIVDLTDPAAPAIAGNWREIVPEFRMLHGITETNPGIVFTGSLPQYVLDARTDPANPTVLVKVEPPTTRFIAATAGPIESPVSYEQWPSGRYALTTLETPFSGPCQETSGGLVVYDTAGWEQTGTFSVSDVFRITRPGLPTEGLVPANAIGCSALGLDAHPRFHRTSTVAVGWAENGVRIFSIDKRRGTLTEKAGFIAPATEAFMPVWVSDDVLYVIDTARGLDVFEVGFSRN